LFDELDWLRDSADLQRLLGHYAAVGATDREAWQDRLMELDGVEARELVRLHGLLIAFSWVEQNTGNTPVCRPGSVPACYRVTAAGIRALKVCRSGPAEYDLDVVAAAGGGAEAKAAQGDGGDAPAPQRRERRRTKTAKAVVVETSGAAVPAEAASEPVVAIAG
jgi:hypothetical protein